MSDSHELLDSPMPATRTESAALLVEVVNVALYGDHDPWNADFLTGDSGLTLPAIDKGHIAAAVPKAGGANITCKYDPVARDALLYGSGEKTHIASLAIGGKTYDFFASSTEYHTLDDEDGHDDVLAEMFDLLENNEGVEEIEAARSLNFDLLADDVTIEVFENLTQHTQFMRNLGTLGIHFGKLIDDESTPGRIAEAEGMLSQAESAEASRTMELSLGATTIDSQTARALTAALREDYDPIAR
jgi:hypothetical protein